MWVQMTGKRLKTTRTWINENLHRYYSVLVHLDPVTMLKGKLTKCDHFIVFSCLLELILYVQHCFVCPKY